MGKNGQKSLKIAQNQRRIMSAEFQKPFGTDFLSKTGRKNLLFMIRDSSPFEFSSLHFCQLIIKSEFNSDKHKSAPSGAP